MHIRNFHRLFGRIGISPTTTVKGGGVAAVVSLVGFATFSFSNASVVHADSARGRATTDQDEMVGGQVLKRQLYEPKEPYPLWDYNWDGRMTKQSSLETQRKPNAPEVTGTTRHIILIRHGQYHEEHRDDKHRTLTPLGRLQAELTGRRLAVMAKGLTEEFGPCQMRVIHSSGMVRAIETAEIIAKHLDGVKVAYPDPMLNEALPAPIVPVRSDINATKEVDENRDRIDKAFHKYFYRGKPGKGTTHEFDIIVCHGNVIRYFFCRALQIPPEAWLRLSTFNCSLTYIMVRPNGYCSARMMGDVGHLNLENSTFGRFTGFAW